jgi:hypothetical protein
MRLPLFIAAYLLTSAGLLAAKDSPNTALNAIKLLPRGEYKKIARIEAREGTPAPERWYIVVHDPKDENGLHEYVVAGGELVASRAVSQFAESVKAEDVVKDSLLKIDSDKVGALAQAYALANNVTITALNYALKKEGAEAVPLWNVGCIDETGKVIGQLVVSASKGTVVSHEGFTAEPGAAVPLETQASEVVDREDRRPRRPPARPAATPTPAEKKDVVSRVGNSLSKFFTGKGSR